MKIPISVDRYYLLKYSHANRYKRYPKTYTVRQAASDEISKILECSGAEKNIELKDKFFDIFKNGAAFIVENKENTIVGYMWISFDNYITKRFRSVLLLEDKNAFLSHGYIKPEHRMKGLHNLLLDAMIQYANEEKGIEDVYTIVVNDNINSLRSHLTYGFVVHRSIVNISSNGFMISLIKKDNNCLSIKLKLPYKYIALKVSEI